MRARRTRFHPLLLVVAGTLSIALLLPPAAASGEVRARTVASGLNNPRGIFLGSGRSYFVAEAGAGGSGPCQPGPFGTTCVGLTGAVTHVTNGSLDRLVRLPSIATTDGSFAFGPHDVAKDDEGDGALFATVGLGGDAAYKAGFGHEGRRPRQARAGHPERQHAGRRRPPRLRASSQPGRRREGKRSLRDPAPKMTPASSPTRERTTC